MKFLDKVKQLAAKAFAFFKKNKVATIIGLSVLAVIVVALLVYFLIIKPKIDYPTKIVFTDSNGKDYTQSEIDELGNWWDEYLKGNNITNPGEITAK